jgi:hypothetical protein
MKIVVLIIALIQAYMFWIMYHDKHPYVSSFTPITSKDIKNIEGWKRIMICNQDSCTDSYIYGY